MKNNVIVFPGSAQSYARVTKDRLQALLCGALSGFCATSALAAAAAADVLKAKDTATSVACGAIALGAATTSCISYYSGSKHDRLVTIFSDVAAAGAAGYLVVQHAVPYFNNHVVPIVDRALR